MVNSSAPTVVDHFTGEILTATDYYSFGSPINGRSVNAGTSYAYGFNGQEADKEIFEGAYTAEYWEYDSRTGRRWNTDPVPLASISHYATFLNNPILYNDPNGDEVKTDKEGAANTNLAVTSVLKKDQANPISYNKEKGILEFDEKVDISGYSDYQKEVLGSYKELIKSEVVTTLKIVDAGVDKVVGEKTLNDLNANGTTSSKFETDAGGNKKLISQDVFVARNPTKSDNTTKEKSEYSGIVNIHEMAGHAFLQLTQPKLDNDTHNKLVEDLQSRTQKVYKVNGAIWYKNSPVQKH